MIEGLKLVILNGSQCSLEYLAYYHEAYSHWKKMWQATFQELDGCAKIDSDNFSRQNEILALFHDKRCVAMVCHRYADLHLPSLLDDTYFSSWPEKTKKELMQLEGRVAIGNQISIDPAFRRTTQTTAMKEILLWLSLHRLKSQEIDFVLGAVREDKSLDQLFIKYGARVLQQNVSLHHVPVALVCFQRKEIDLLRSALPLSWLSKIYQQRAEDPYCHQEFLTPIQRRAS